MKKLVKLEGLDYNPSENMYYVKKFDDGVYLCSSKMNRTGRIKK
jgi:hypothetical protein